MGLKHGWFAAAVFVVLTSLSGCDGCRPVGPGGEHAWGELGVVYPDADGTPLTSRDAVYDFGTVFMGQRKSLKLTVKNLAVGSLDLDRLDKDSGDESQVFEVQFEPRTLEAGASAEFDMSFLAPADESPTPVAHEVRLLLRAINAAPGEETAVITLKALAVPGVCEVPATFDFGSVARGDRGVFTFPLQNPTQLEATATVGEPYSSSGDHLAFGFTAASARGTVSLHPGTSRALELTFSPTEIRSYLAFVKVRVSEQCPEYPVQLTGKGVDSVLTWGPSPVDFGYAAPGVEVTRELVFTNEGSVEARLTGIHAVSAEYRVVAASEDPTRLTVPARGGTAKLTLAFKPGVLGPRPSQLQFATNLPRQTSGSVPLRGYGGGPAIQVVPSPVLDFGKVAYFEGATPPSFQIRKLTVMNVGTRPAIPDPNANLRLGPGGTGTAWSIAKANSTSSDGELTADFATAYPAAGLEAVAGKNLIALAVTLTPTSDGKKEFNLVVRSNDPQRPEVQVKVLADVVRLPPCNFSLTPTALNFGLVAAPGHRDMSFTFTNLGNNADEICLVSGVELGAGSDPVFSLPAGAIASKELQPRESLAVMVRAWPQGATPSTVSTVTGSVDLFISSPTTPQRTVSLSATLAPSCLSVSPDDLDFGTVKVGCGSRVRTFSLYNTCPNPIVVNSVVLQAAAGQPAGGPNCPGLAPCPELTLVSTPVIPSGGLSLAPGVLPPSFSVKYSPIDFGSDSGAVALNVVQGGQSVTYLVTLQGHGDAQGLNNDIFQQDIKPKADLLLVIDDSGSMSDKQQALAANFTSFIKFAQAEGVDYHLAVTTTDADLEGGRFVSGPGHPEKVLTPTTPDVQTKFQAKVNVGTVGSAEEMCFEPALKALTAPLISDPAANGGFLRPDAMLSVVCISDELEQSPLPVSTYYNQLMNVKGVKNATQFSLSVIAGMFPTPPPGCTADPDDGRYAMMAGLTNGLTDSICTPDWSATLERLGKITFGFRTNFFLNAAPDLSGTKAFEVNIDGVPLPMFDGRGAAVWTYDPVANSVNFDPAHVPEPGQTLTVNYYVACL